MAEYGQSDYGVGTYGTAVDGGGGGAGVELKPALTSSVDRGPREWGIEIVDMKGISRAFIDPSNLTVTVRTRGYCESKGSLLTVDEKAVELNPGNRAIKVYVDGVLRHHAPIVQPLEGQSEVTNYATADPWYGMQTRFIQKNADGTTVSFTAEDAMDVLWALVTQQEGRAPTHIRKGTFTASVPVSGDYNDGQSVYDAADAITTMDGGPFFRVDPVDGVSGVLGELNGGPTSGIDHPEVRFEYGDETLANIDDDFQVQFNLPATAIRATGGTDENGNTLSSYAQAAQDVVDEYGLIEKQISFADVTNQAQLDALAVAHVQTAPTAVFTINTLWDGDASVPRLWQDFDRGDTVRIRFRYGWMDLLLKVRVNECTVEVGDDDGRERLTGLVLEEVA